MTKMSTTKRLRWHPTVEALKLRPSKRTEMREILRQFGKTVDVKDAPRSKYMPHQGKREIARRLRNGTPA